MNPRPPLQLPPHIRELLAKHGPDCERRVEQFLESCPRPCIYVTSRRTDHRPLKRGALGRLLGLAVAQAQLSVTRSKFGGRPYLLPQDLPWGDYSFLGQINFAEITNPPQGLPSTGIFGIDAAPLRALEASAFRVRWYPHPDPAAAADPGRVEPTGKYEAEMCFRPGWSVPGGEAWEAVLPKGDEELWEAWNDWTPEGYLEDERDKCHRMGGHRSAGLDEPYHFVPPPGRSDHMTEYEMLLRVTFDNAAGLAWGTNWVYVLVHTEDMRDGRLERAVVTGANY